MQLHKRFTQEQVKAILNGYQQGNLTVQSEILYGSNPLENPLGEKEPSSS